MELLPESSSFSSPSDLSAPIINTLEKYLLYSYSVTVKAATLIFISGLGSAISSAQEQESGSIYLVNS